MNVGFHLCIHDWCFQKGTKEQYTRCKKASEDGRTCYYPTIRYGSTIGGNPYKHGNNNILNWCLQLFPTSIKGIATYNNHTSWYSKANYSTTAGALGVMDMMKTIIIGVIGKMENGRIQHLISKGVYI